MKEKYLLSIMILLVFLTLFTTTSLALIPGDFGSEGGGPPDGCVDLEDLMIFTMAYSSAPSDSNWNPSCDIAGPDGTLTPDGIIDFEDLMVFAMHYGECDEDTSLSPITISDSTIFDGKTVIDGGKHTITVKFAAPVASVRVFIANYIVQEGSIRNFWGIPSNAVEVAMSTADGKTYTGTADFGEGDCDEEWIYVLSGESCCPVVCSRTVIVDGYPPEVDLIADVDVVECGTDCELDSGYIVTITSDGFTSVDLPCDPLCCGDCSALAGWTVTVWDTQPFDPDTCACEEDPCVDPIKVCTGSGCDVTCVVFDCVTWVPGEYYVRFEAVDIVANPTDRWGILELTSGHTATLNDAILDPDDCLIKLDTTAPPPIGDDIMGPCTYNIQ